MHGNMLMNYEITHNFQPFYESLYQQYHNCITQVVEAETVRKFEIELDKHMGEEMFDF